MEGWWSMATHFHIQWASGTLDWERFNTRWEAESLASQLAQPNESFTIEEFEESCPRCLNLLSPKRAGPQRKKDIA
jgi:hypothetical protein